MLPRHLRSDICNGYYCDSLVSYQKKMEERENPEQIVAIQRSSTYWNRYEQGVVNDIVNVALVDEEQVVEEQVQNFSL